MTEIERKRIEKDGRMYGIACPNDTPEVGYVFGATYERNLMESELKQARINALDEAIELFRSVPWDQNIIALIEKLKHKQP